MNVLQNLLNYYNSLPASGTNRYIVGRMLVNLRELGRMSLEEVATLVSASRTTVWRIVKQMGYADYRAFSYELNQAVDKYSLYNRGDMGAADRDHPGNGRKSLQSGGYRGPETDGHLDVPLRRRLRHGGEAGLC